MSVAALVIIVSGFAIVEAILVCIGAYDPFTMTVGLFTLLMGSVLFLIGAAWWAGWMGSNPSLFDLDAACRMLVEEAVRRGSYSWFCS